VLANFPKVITIKNLLESLLQCLKRIVVLANFPKVIAVKKLLESLLHCLKRIDALANFPKVTHQNRQINFQELYPIFSKKTFGKSDGVLFDSGFQKNFPKVNIPGKNFSYSL